MNTDNVTRFEVIDHRDCITCDGDGLMVVEKGVKPCTECYGLGSKGRTVVAYGVNVELLVQDDGRTLKVVLNNIKEPV